MRSDPVVRWTSDLQVLTRAYRERLEDLSARELNWKPAPDAWSVGQILEHLIVTNESYYPEVEALREGRARVPWHGRIGFVTRLIGRLVLKAVEPERRRKVKTFEAWEPSASAVPADIVERFVEHQEGLVRFVRDSADLVREGAVVRSPALPFLVYDLETAFEIVVTHEKRHLNQVDETLEAVGAER